MRPDPLSLALTLALASPAALAQPERDPRHEDAEALDRIVITASPLAPGSDDLVQPVEVISGEELDRRKANSIGETVAREIGVQSSYFGPGVGRPIIRGLDGARVQVLEGGVSALDVSTVSVDHAVGIEPFLADQIEILKGPSTLLYGGGAIGGAVNVVDGRIPEMIPAEPLTGRAELRGNTVNDETTGMVRLDGASGSIAWHADLFYRDTSDYEIPGFAELEEEHDEHEEEDHEEEGVEGLLENSAVETRGGALGASWIGERGFFGVAVSGFQTVYGVPGHAHGEGHEGEEGHEDGHEDEHEEEGHEGEEEEALVSIDLDQVRIDAKGAVYEPWSGIEKLAFRFGNNNYRHVELEGDEVGTRFDNDGYEGRVELVHAPIAGWRGAIGSQFSRRDFTAIGEEAFVPPSVTEDVGIFLIEEADFDSHKLEFGARYDDVSVSPDGGVADADFGALSLSAGALWRATEALHLSLGVDRAERAPTAEELFSDGPHVATRSYEVGDAGLDTETAKQVELGVHLHAGRLSAKAAVYRNDIDDFIYLAETGLEEDGLPLRQWTQADAEFRGIEAEAELVLADNATGRWDLRVFGDRVDAELAAGGNLPRIAPSRFGADLSWARDGWRAALGAVRYADQDDVASFETPTEGYTLVDAHVAYHWDTASAGWEVFVDATNLTDREARVHTSFLKDLAPLPGRAIAFGIRAYF